MSSGGARPLTTSATTRPVTGPSSSPFAPWPLATIMPSTPGSRPISGRSSSLVGRRPTLTSRNVASPSPGQRRRPSEKSRRNPLAVGPRVEADVLDRGAQCETTFGPRHDVVAADRLEDRPAGGVGVETKVHDLAAHGPHPGAHAERPGDVGGPRASRDHDGAAGNGRGRRLDAAHPATVDRDARVLSGAPIDPECPRRVLDRCDHRPPVHARAARVVQRVTDLTERREAVACVVDRQRLEDVRVPSERDLGTGCEHVVVGLAEADSERPAHVVVRIGCAELGEVAHESAVVRAGEVGEVEERRDRAPIRLRREDAGARVGRATCVVPIHDRHRVSVSRELVRTGGTHEPATHHDDVGHVRHARTSVTPER